MVILGEWFSSMTPGPTAPAPLGKSLEMQVLRPPPVPRVGNAGVEPSACLAPQVNPQVSEDRPLQAPVRCQPHLGNLSLQMLLSSVL